MDAHDPALCDAVTQPAGAVVAQPSIAFGLAKGVELIPGYVLEERIGVGGYGEVWSATAPGGLLKAIKFVYGRLDESRAMRELKSLHHVKALRHPFLLTLERIEFIDEHLVIVTEIADSNLRLQFEECRRAGMPGIPRDELLGYLQEAADALDYLSESHSLQHLDVKPENLLLLARHVKVADFGLLKELRETQVSMVSGLTPGYAAPEVFDGRPHRRSDQYSLAIVYQEMATGTLPFDGRTSAALAAQHLHAAPNLAGLTPHERFAVGKALAKSPERRFASCRELVARLAQGSGGALLTGMEGGTGNAESGAERTAAPAAPADAARPPQVHDGRTIAVDAPATTVLPPLALEGLKVRYRPTVFLGVGGTGGRVLARVRQRLIDCFGDDAACEAIRFLWIDTDQGALGELSSRTGEKGLREDQTVAAPLQATWHYRNGPLGSLASLSRRWIYNIPRSLRTEGLRLLGRLALLDHAEKIVAAIRAAVTGAVDEQAVAATTRHTGLAFEAIDPRVVLVANIAGGTGSGMAVDLAFAVRQVLAESGLSDDHAAAVLAYSTAGSESNRSLPPATAYACLQELNYFSLAGSCYPGEPSLGLAGFRQAGAVLKNIYLVDLGDELNEARFVGQLERLATCLALEAASPAAAFFDECRRLDARPEGAGLRVRSLGLAGLRADAQAVPPQWIEAVCQALIRAWQGNADAGQAEDAIEVSDYARFFENSRQDSPPQDPYEAFATQECGELGLTPAPLVESLRQRLRVPLGSDAGAFLQRVIDDGPSADAAEWSLDEAVHRLHTVAGVKEDDESARSQRLQSLRQLAAAQAAALGQEIGRALQESVLRRTELAETRVAGARRAADFLAARLSALEAELYRRFHDAEAARGAFLEKLRELDAGAKQRTRREIVLESLRNYVEPVLDALLLEAAAKTLGGVRPLVTAASYRLRDLWIDLNRLGEAFAAPPQAEQGAAPAAGETASAAFFGPLADVIAAHRDEVVRRLDGEICARFLGGEKRLQDLFPLAPGVREELLGQMRRSGRKMLLQCIRENTVARISEALGGEDSPGLAAALHACRDLAAPRLLDVTGGTLRLALATPEDMDAGGLAAAVADACGEQPTSLAGGWPEPLLCYEADGLGLDEVAARFLRARPDCEELANRLHARIDVSW